MAHEAAYRIQDEPAPSGLGHLIANPVFPLLSVMLAGAWLALPWFVFNSFALGSPTRRKELLLAVAAPLGMMALFLGLGLVYVLLDLSKGSLPYLQVLLVVWKLAVAYWLFDLQKRSFALHEYFGGRVRNGLPVMAAGFLLKGAVLKAFGGSGWWLMVAG
jgi:hypothetical protein